MDDPGVKLALARYVKSVGATARSASEQQNLQRISQVHIYEGKLAKLPDMNVFPNAKRLQAAHNFISSIAGAHSDALEDVDVSYNRLSDWPEIGGRMTLSLNISNNILSHSSPTLPLPHLMELDLSCQNTDSPFAENFGAVLARFCPMLQTLDIGSCHVGTFKILEHAPQMKKLVAGNNCLLAIEDVVPFLPDSLVFLDLQGNGIVKDRKLFDNICARCPHIRTYNGKDYTAAQVEFSAAKLKRSAK